MKTLTTSSTGRNRLSLLFLAVAIFGSFSGCGAKTYEERLETTKAYYDYIDRLNRNLGPQFSESGVSMRAPKQFTLIPAPPRRPKRPARANNATGAGNSAAEDSEEPRKKDPRQPDFLDVELPGLIAAWQADLETLGGSGGSAQPVRQTGYIYLLSNAEFWRTFKTKKGNESNISPIKFHDDVMDILTGTLNIEIGKHARGSATDRVNKWFTETVPAKKDERFAPKKEITTITLVPDLEEGEESEAFQREYQVYLFANGDMKIVLIYALPRNVSAAENLIDRTLFSLQTLNVSAEKPRGAPGGKAASPAGAAPKPGPGF